MAWFKIDDGMHRSRKVLAIPRRHRLGAVGLFTMAGSWCADEETDGVFPDFMISEWGGTQALVDALLKVGLWTNVPRSSDERSANERRVLDEQATGVRFTKWAEYQPTRAELLDKRAKSAEKLRNWRARNHGSNPVTDPVTNPVTDPVTNPVSNPAPIPSHPIPSQNSTSSVGAASRRATRLPASWTPTDEHQQRAREASIDIGREVIKFRTHAEDKGRTSKSWNAAFTQWLIKAAEYAQRDGSRPQRRVASDDWMQQ